MSALAIVCAISPPIVPAPTTAALKTNMSLCLGRGSVLRRRRSRARSLVGGPGTTFRQLDPEVRDRRLQRALHRAADEQQVDHGRDEGPPPELVSERQRHLD